MEQKILELIRESLPEKEVGIVKQVFVELEQLRAYKIATEPEMIDLKTKITTVAVREHEVNIREQTLDKRQVEIVDRETAVNKKDQELNEKLAKKGEDIMREMVNVVFKPASFYKSYQQAIANNNGYHDIARLSETVTE